MNPSLPSPGWWHQVLALGAAARARQLARRLRSPDRDARAQTATFHRLMAQFARTEFGRSHGLRAGLSYPLFAAQVAPRPYEEFAPWVERMKQGQADVLWPGRCRYYAVSSGTTQGRTKYLPVTPAMIAHFRRTGLDSLSLYAQRAEAASVFRGRQLFLGGSTSLQPIPAPAPFQAWAGDLSGITAMHLPRWVERHWYEPGCEIAQLSDWPAKLEAIASRTVRQDVRLIAGIPSWVLIFAEVMRRHTGRDTLKEIWPNLECLVHGGVPLAPFATELRECLGTGVQFHEVYPASEGFIAAQDTHADAGLRLLTGAGIFYEFLPMADFDESRLAELGRHAVPLSGVQAGVDYALLMTTPGGLCRYVIGDVVRFVSTTPPRLVYVGRTRLQLSAFGEHVLEKEVTDALTTVCARHGVVISNFHVAPLFVDPTRGRHRGCHEWWVELRSPGAALLERSSAAAEIDRELQRLNDDYEAKRLGGGLDVPVLRLVAEGTFERWLRQRGKWGGQNKTPRCSSGREIAEELRAASMGVEAALSAPLA